MFRGLGGSKKAVFAACVAGAILLVLVVVGRSFRRAGAVLNQARGDAASAGAAKFALTTLDQRKTSRFHHFLHASEFLAAAVFDGDLFIATHSGLLRYGANGALRQRWWSGEVLPSVPLTSLTVRRGVATPELWIGTEGGGVLIFNGRLFRQLLPEQALARHVTALLPLANGQVLVGTRNAGLYLADGRRLALLHSQFSKTEVTALAGDEDAIWIGTRRDGVWCWRAGTATHFTNELPDRQVLSLEAKGESSWVGTALGVAEFTAGKFRRRLGEGLFAGSLVRRGSTLLVGTIDQGMVTVSLEPHARAIFAAADRDTRVVSFARAGGELLAVTPSAVMRVDSGERVISALAEEMADDHVTALNVDARGRIWIGYFDHGLDVVDRGNGGLSHFENDALYCVNRIKTDEKRGVTAVAAANGLVLFDASGTPRQTINQKSGALSSHVTDVLFRESAEGDGRLVAATPAGISFLDGAETSGISAFQDLVNNHAYTLAEYDGALFAGTLGGFSLVKNGLVEASFTTANSTLPQNWITASTVWGDSLYMGTYGSGVVRFDRQHRLNFFREFRTRRFEINPNAMVATGWALYAGTSGQGLAVLRRGEERWQFVSEGLPSENVTALAARDGELYVGTANGLVRAEERGLNP